MKIPTVPQVKKGWNVFSNYYADKMETCTSQSAQKFFEFFQTKNPGKINQLFTLSLNINRTQWSGDVHLFKHLPCPPLYHLFYSKMPIFSKVSNEQIP